MKAGQRSIGHPVNVATGVVYSTHQDYVVGGKVDMVWERLFSTTLAGLTGSPLGPGWTTRYFATLTCSNAAYSLRTPEGDREDFVDISEELVRGGHIVHLGSFQELSKEGDRFVVTRWHVESGQVDRYLFLQGAEGEPWPLESIENASGQALDMIRDRAGRLVGVRQRLEKRTLAIEYSRENLINQVSFVLPNAQRQLIVRYAYDDAGRLASAENALSQFDRYEYDQAGRMTREIVKDGGIFSFRYDPKGRCIRTTGQERYDEKTIRYFDGINWTEVTDSLGHTVRYECTPSGQISTEIDAMGAIHRTEYDEHGRIVATVHPGGGTVRYEYDVHGNRSKTVDLLGHETSWAFNLAHLPIAITNPAGAWKYTYDSANYLITSETPLGGVWRFYYDSVGNLVRLTDPNGASRRQRFSETGSLLESSDWEDHYTHYEIDPFGKVTMRTDPLGGVTSIEYDLLGRAVSFQLPDGSKLLCDYDRGGNLALLADGSGHTTRWRYGPCGRLLSKTDAAGNVVAYHWGSEPQRLEKIVNANGEFHQFYYDAAGRLIRRREFDGREFHFERDKAGNVVRIVDDHGHTWAFTHDPGGNVVAKTFPDGSSSSYTYDALGNLVSAINSACEVVFERDALGRIIRERQGTYVVASRYDATGNRVWMQTSMGHEVSSQYDGNGNVARLIVKNQDILEFQRNACGEETSRVLPGGVVLHQQYDQRGTVVEQRVDRSRAGWSRGADVPRNEGWGPALPEGVMARTYRYDSSGLLTTIVDRHGTTTYRYDPAERLIHAIRENSGAESYVYDGNGNMMRMSREEQKGEVLEHERGDRLVRCGDTEYSYDDDGRVIRKVESGRLGSREWQFVWDGAGQLRSVRNPNGALWTYSYDALGRRIRKDGPGKIVHYQWDQLIPVHQIENEKTKATWLFENNSFTPLGTVQGGALYCVVPDHLGTPRELVDRAGRIVWSGKYGVWGKVDKEGQREIDCPLRFQGQWFDEESGLHYNMFRYYDPEVGRFISPDPIGLLGSLNTYSYAPNPVNWVDPLGLTGEAGCGSGGGSEDGDKPPQYFIQNGVRRAVAARERQSPTVPAIIFEPGKPPVRTDIPLSQLNSPKPVIPRDQRMVNNLMMPGPPPPIHVSPMPGPVPSVPLADVKLVKARP